MHFAPSRSRSSQLRLSQARRPWLASVLVGTLVALSVGIGASLLDLSADVAHADDSSAVTITAAQADSDLADAPLPGLSVTLSQTTDLVSQGLTISWTGGKQSTQPSTDIGGANFLQIAQCWGDDPSVPAGQAAQPDRTTCVYGAFLTPGATRDNFVNDEAVAPQDEQYTAPGDGFANPTYTSIPFRSPDGSTVASVVENKKNDVDVNTNQFFTAYTSNEVKWAGSGADGSGSVKFEVQTVTQTAGLDCGKPITAADGTKTGKSCWIVVIPRGTADAGETQVNHSGLLYSAWKHRIAFRVGFKPIGLSCSIGASEQQISGSELVAGAVSSWQPALCAKSGGSIFTISNEADSDALQAASDPSAPAALALTSRPLAADPDNPDPDTYAPIALSGISISFAIDRRPLSSAATPASVSAQSNQAFTSLKLTPRLVAKLLTNSYLDSLPGDKSDLGYKGPSNPGHNARNLTTDPDFLAVNDSEWAYEALVSPSLADLLVPQGRSDVAYQLWRYVISDPSAAAFLAGTPDQWGMIVNPNSSTNAQVNKNPAPSTYPIDNFPKADPGAIPATTTPDGVTTAGEINLVTWRPYTNDLDTSAYNTLRGDGLVLGAWDATKTPPVYLKTVRNNPGYQNVLGLTDTASAAKYQVVSASLQNSAGAFVAPSTASMSAAGAAMTPTAVQPQVYEYDPAGAAAKAATTAYPLTMPVYAATNPAQNDAATRASYAAFISYAATTGQTPGSGVGQLPAGYAPLPASWRSQASAAAAAIAAGVEASGDLPTEAFDSGDTGDDSFSADSLSSSDSEPMADAESTSPTAGGKAAASLASGSTPKDPSNGGLGSVVPLSLLSGLASAAAVPLISRIRRRP